MIQQLIKDFPLQLSKAVDLGKGTHFSTPSQPIRQVVIAGLGGSGIAGSILINWAYNSLQVPISVCKTYQLPAFVNENTLLIISSFSGNTEETLAALWQGLASKAHIFCLSSGGQVLQIAREQGLDHVQLPVEAPCPRQHLGYSLVQLLFILKGYGLWGIDVESMINQSLALLATQEVQIHTKAKEIAQFFYQKKPILYADSRFEGMLMRFQQQINENAKQLCHMHIFPEMNHNELVGWGLERSYYADFAVLYVRTPQEHAQVKRRFEICKEIFAAKAPLKELHVQGDSLIAQTIYLLHLSDWVSWYLAQRNSVDAFEIHVINYLKNKLAE